MAVNDVGLLEAQPGVSLAIQYLHHPFELPDPAPVAHNLHLVFEPPWRVMVSQQDELLNALLLGQEDAV